MLNIVLGFLLPVLLHAQEPHYSILQGVTSDTVAQFTVVARQGEALTFVANGRAPQVVKRVTYPGSPWVVYRLRVSQLAPRRIYRLQVLRDGVVRDERTFNTLEVQRADGVVAMGSCMLRQLHNASMWQTVASERPDVLLLLGDTVYLDRNNLLFASPPENGLQIWTSHVESRNTLALYQFKHLLPTFAIWDDHDTGGDNVDAKFPMLAEARRSFDAFFANDAITGFSERGPGVSQSFRLFGTRFIMLDGRSFRGQERQSPMFGGRQVQWLYDKLERGSNLVLNGSQFYGGFIRKDSLEYNWPEYVGQFSKSLRAQAQRKGAVLAFASGDVHFSELQVLEPSLYGYPTVEVTSSSLHSFAMPGHHYLKPDNPRRVAATGTHNVILLEFPARPQGFEFKARSVGWRGNTLFYQQVRIEPAATYASCAEALIENSPD